MKRVMNDARKVVSATRDTDVTRSPLKTDPLVERIDQRDTRSAQGRKPHFQILRLRCSLEDYR